MPNFRGGGDGSRYFFSRTTRVKMPISGGKQNNSGKFSYLLFLSRSFILVAGVGPRSN